MAIALKTSGKIEGTNRKINLNILEPKEGENGFAAFINEEVNGEKLPGHRVNVFINGKDDNRWLSVSAPIRVQDEDGNFVLQPRKNSDGSFLNDKGEVVDSADKAAQQFEYIKYDDNGQERIVYGTLANINIKNEKQGGVPTKFTILNTKIYSDEEALQIARKSWELRNFEEGTPEHAEAAEELNTLRRETGTFTTLFIDQGHQFLRDLGFEVRERVRENTSDSPAP